MARAHLIPPALALLLGVLAEYDHFGFPALMAAVALAFVVRSVSLRLRATLLAALAIGLCSAAFHIPSVVVESRTETFHGISLGEVTATAHGSSFRFRLANGLEVRAITRNAAPVPGATLAIRGRLEPFDLPRNPGEPSQRELELEHGFAGELIHGVILASGAPVRKDPRVWLAQLRSRFAFRLRQQLTEPYATLATGILWGERGALPTQLRDAFQTTGTVHILVTAGLHLGLIAAISTVLLERCGLARGVVVGVVLALVWGYAALSGFHLPTLRAAVMLSCGLIARILGARALSWNSLAAAAIVICIAAPYEVVSSSFALSFSCVAAILLFTEPLASFAVLWVGTELAEPVALCCAAQLGLWPLSAALFFTAAPYALVANLAVVPVVGAVLLSGYAEIACSGVPQLAFLCHALASITTSLLSWIVAVVEQLAALPGGKLAPTPPEAWRIIGYDALMIGAALLLRSNRLRVSLLIALCACTLVLWPRPPPVGLQIIGLDVGQADAIFVRTPHASYLIDTGGVLERGASAEDASPAESAASRILLPFLARADVHHLTGILLTHPHGDHVGGCAPLLHTLGADWIADSGQRYGGRAFHDCIAAAHETRTPILEPRAGDVWHLADGVTLRFFAPSQPYFTDDNAINENSLVFMLEYKKIRGLFTGDAGAEAEARMLAAGYDLHADFLKVGHHGSAYSSTSAFIATVHPRIAIISDGRHNLFGHPAPSTLTTLTRAGVRFYRTDLCGAIKLEGNQVQTMLRCQ